MTWLLRLYPPGWRRRYGGELADLIAAQRFSIGTVIDLVAGAIDAWLHPHMTAAISAGAAVEGKGHMFAKMMKLRCAGYGPNVTPADQWKSAGVMLGGTVVLTLAWMWLHVRIGDNPYVDSLSMLTFLAPLLVSMRYTYLKGRPASTQAVFVAGSLALVTIFFVVAGWIAAQL